MENKNRNDTEWGYVLIIAVAVWHTNLIVRGIKLEEKVSDKIQIFILPLFYAFLSFYKEIYQ